jgi:hypothetical protein
MRLTTCEKDQPATLKNSMKTRTLIFVILFFLISEGNGAADYINTATPYIAIMQGDRRLRLSEIREIAEEAIRAKDPTFDPGVNPAFSFRPKKSTDFLLVDFSERVGERYWWVYFDRNLKVSSIKTGILKQH